MRHELGLPRAVCKYEDVFPNELLGLPLHRNVYFTIVCVMFQGDKHDSLPPSRVRL